MSAASFFKCNRSELAKEISKKPGVLMILFHLALVTPRTGPEENKWIKIDYQSLGLTRKQFRVAEEYIIRGQLGATRRANKGTWIKLISKTIFDINEDDKGQHWGQQRASLYIQEERNSNNIYKTDSEKDNINASIITEENTPPFQTYAAKVSPPARSPLEQALITIAIKGGKSVRFTPSQMDQVSQFDQASVVVSMRIAVENCRGMQVSFPYFKKILEQHGLEKGTVTTTERRVFTDMEIIKQFESAGYGPRPLPKFPLTLESNVQR